jgi:hypothetical protein
MAKCRGFLASSANVLLITKLLVHQYIYVVVVEIDDLLKIVRIIVPK